MHIAAIDQYQDLYSIQDAVSQDLVDKILTTDWLSLPWQRQEGQERWARRRIDENAVPWMNLWHSAMQDLWPALAHNLRRKLQPYSGTAWWLDEPGFTCSLHTDGEMPGAMQLTWIGSDQALGTAFYNYKNADCLRYQFSMKPNSGYIMINTADTLGYRHLQWHAMLTPVPAGTYRLTSYTWIFETV